MPSYLMSANDRWLSAPATMILFFGAGMTNVSIGLWFLQLIWPIYLLTQVQNAKMKCSFPSGQDPVPAVSAVSPSSSASSEATLPAVEVPTPRRSVAQRRSGLCGPRTSLGALVRRWPSVPLDPRAPRPSVSTRRQSAFPRLVEDGYGLWDL